MQGDHCVYDHGPDPVVVDDSALEKMVKIPEKPAPHNFTIPPPGYHPPNPPPPGVEPIFAGPPPPGPRAVEGYNPEAPSLSAADFTMPPPPIAVPINPAPWRPSPYAVPTTANVVVPTIGYDPSGGIPVDPSSANAVPRPPVMRGGMRGRGRGGPMTGRFPQVSNNRGDGKTLQVKKIPPELNNIAKLNEHFATFGSIVNMQVRFNGEADSALISYASRHEAMAAYKSPQPVLNNRFIKVFFYNPDVVAGSTPGQDGVHRSVLNSGVNVDKPSAEGAPLPAQPPKVATIETSKFVNQQLKETREKIIEARRKLKLEKANQISLYAVNKRQNDLLQKLVDRQKALMVKLRSEADNMDSEEKKKHMTLVKKLMDKITAGKKEIYDLSAKLRSCTENIAELEKVIASEKSGLGKEKGTDSDGRDSASPSSPSQEGKVAVVPTQNLLKRKAEDGSDVDAKRGPATVAVKSAKLDDTKALVEHMGQYGDILNVEVVNGDEPMVLITFRRKEEADQAVVDGPLFKGTMLDVTWHRPAGENSPLSADKMLAGIPQSESDDES